jgi:hypothetical protein
VPAIKYKAPPTCAKFMRSEAFFRIIAGPVGSGKTTACILEMLSRAIEQEKGVDGLRHTRFAIVRQTLKQLKDTVLKDVLSWLDGIATYKVSDAAITVSFGDVRSEWLLIPLDDPEDQRRLLSMQLTGAWLSEAIELSTEIVEPILGRCGRFPSAATKPAGHTGKWPTWYGAIADTNMPTEGDNWHTLMELETPAHWQIFIQPGGLDVKAENIENLPGGREYYTRLAEGHSEDWIKRYVHAQYGNDPTGSAVFKETFKRGFHSIKLSEASLADGQTHAVEPSFGYPIVVVQDFGRNPCALICQMDHRGRGLVLEEIVSSDIGLEKHLNERLKPKLAEKRYFGRPVYVIGDPAGRAKNTTFEETSFDTLKRHGFNAFPAPTNDIDKRIAAVENILLQQRDGGPALLIDEDKCPTLVLALHGRYRYTRKKTNGQLSVTPEKLHPWSDLADDLEYFCLALVGGMSGYVANRMNLQAARVLSGPRPRVSRLAWT